MPFCKKDNRHLDEVSMINELLKQVAVIGANGKMGRGIALLLLQEMARCEAQETGALGREYRLRLIDTDERGQTGLRQYLRTQLIKYAEKNIISLREFFRKNSKLIDNGEIITAFVEGAINIAMFDTSLQSAAGAHLIFEAAVEDLEVKKTIFDTLKKVCGESTYYFTNTSSIPISLLDAQSNLNHRIIGFHFYNPPPLQRLVEVISSEKTDPKLASLATQLGQRLGKTLVPSHDIAGFIGNGHFIRELSFACQKVRELSPQYSQEAAITLLNHVTERFILRPMGIFQLADYVGLDVCHHIYEVMQEHISTEIFHFDLIAQFLQAGLRGGQLPDGSQRGGIFQYEKGRPIAVYSLQEKAYKPLDNHLVSSLPIDHVSWKALVRDPKVSEKLPFYFHTLFGDHSESAKMAQEYLLKSKSIAEGLVESGVAKKVEDVNTVLQTGFAHLYGPVNSYY